MTTQHLMQGVRTALASVASAVVYLRVPFDCTLKHLVIYAASPLPGAATFDVNYGDTPAAIASIYGSPSGRPVIATGQSKVSQSSLSVALHADGILTLDLDAPPEGGVPGPVFVLFEVDDGLPAGVTVAEADGSPSVLATVLRVGTGDLTDMGGGNVRLRTVGDVLGQANGAAQLDGAGKLVITQLPAVAINERFVVGSEAAMLALTAERGDVAFRTDASEVYFLLADDPTQLSNWALWLHPAMPTSLPPTGTAGGDVEGNFPNSLEVVAIRSVAVSDLAPSSTNFGDNFDDNSFDAVKWARSDNSLVLEQNSRLEITTFAFAQNAVGLDVTHRQVQAKVTPNSGRAWFRLLLDGGLDYLEVRLNSDSGTMSYGRHINGTGDDWIVNNAAYDGSPRWLRFEHRAADGLWHFLMSSDGASWSDLGGQSAPSGAGQSACVLRMFSLLGTVYYDDVTSTVPIGTPGISDGDVLRYKSATDSFVPAPGVRIKAVSGAPSGPPTGLASGETEIRYDCVNHRQYIWNPNIGDWDWRSFPNA